MRPFAARMNLGYVPPNTYVFDTAERAERERLEEQSAVWDPFTLRNLEDVGVGTGLQCLDVGAGAGSVAAWLHERVTPQGHVVATDLEPRWLEPLAAPNFEVRRHNVVTDPLEVAGYDLVHARLVLMHLPERDAVLEKLVAALRPDGWLVLEDYDVRTADATYPTDAVWTKVTRAISMVLQSAGSDSDYGSRLVGGLTTAGLADVRGDGIVLARRVPELRPLVLPVLERVRTAIMNVGAATVDEVEHVARLLRDDESRLFGYSPMLVSARGRRMQRA
jgi:SAM-dependent methyltransferase